MSTKDVSSTAVESSKDTTASDTYKPSVPELKEFLQAGVQFGHETKKWDPKMAEFIFSKRGNIHIVDLSKTLPMLEKAMTFLYERAKLGPVLFVGTKRQAAEIVKNVAVQTNSFFAVTRWPGGLLTNFEMITRSLNKLKKFEEEFEKGVEDRTKFEVSQLKKEWEKLNRTYEGVKTMTKLPSALVVVDAKFEKSALKEAKLKNIPVVALVDTNTNPNIVDFPIPANDDAIKSIELLTSLLGQAVKDGNKGEGPKHIFKDYSKLEVKLVKKEVEHEEVTELESASGEVANKPKVIKIAAASSSKGGSDNQGILEKIQAEAETKKVKKAQEKRTKSEK